MRRVRNALAAITLALCFPWAVPAAPPDAASKLQWWVMERTEDGAQAEFFVILKDRADLALAERLPTKEQKGWFVYGALAETAELSQRPLRTWLDARGVGYRTFFIANAILVTGGRDLALELAARADVARIEGNPAIRNDLPLGEGEPAEEQEGSAVPPVSPSSIEWNIQKTKAPEVWALGYRGQGIVVGGQDTGYRWTHAALKGKYRGWDGAAADHNYNWHDSVHSGGGSCGPDSPQPCDDYGHGTHTMGTVLGDDGAGNQVGMAPGAKWIGCRNMNGGVGTPASYLECFQFFLAPTRLDGTGADPSRAPDVTVNSWSCPTSEGCGWETLQQAVDAQRAAGIMTVSSAGNSGSGCGTVTDPPAIYTSAFAVGATSSSNTMAGFSSRGPSQHTDIIKPDLVAPGVSVRSSAYGSDVAYTYLSGTSMAAPNVAGGVALLWSARECYRRDPDASAALLRASATRLTAIVEGCGGDYVAGPNNTWGGGLLDVLAAVNGGSCGALPPAVASVAPSSGTTAGGTVVTITGSNFQEGAAVSMGGSGATSVSVAGSTLLTCIAPPHAAGAVDVTVTNPDGGSSTLAGGFTYVDPPCTLACAAQVPGSASAGTAVSFQASSTPSGCAGQVAYQWGFGDGQSSSAQNPTHAYASDGDFAWSLTVSVDGVTCLKTGSIHVVPAVTPPAITGVSKATGPFRLKVYGSNFHPGCTVKIDGVQAPSTQHKNSGLVLAKGGAALKDMVPKGVTVLVTVVNNDDGGVTAPFSYTR
jgi:hypothetical protein